MKLSLRTKLMAVLVLAPALLLLAAIGAIWTLDYRQRVAEQGGVFRGEAVQVARSLRLAVEQSIGSLNDFISPGRRRRVAVDRRGRAAYPVADNARGPYRATDEQWSSLRLDSPEIQTVLNNALAAKLARFWAEELALRGNYRGGWQGRLVAATGRPTDYDQSDENWWSEGMRLSRVRHCSKDSITTKARVCLPSNRAPDRPGGIGLPIGVLKAVVNVSSFLAPVTVLSTQSDAQAEVVGKDGVVLLQLADKSFVPRAKRFRRKRRASCSLNIADGSLRRWRQQASMVGLRPSTSWDDSLRIWKFMAILFTCWSIRPRRAFWLRFGSGRSRSLLPGRPSFLFARAR